MKRLKAGLLAAFFCVALAAGTMANADTLPMGNTSGNIDFMGRLARSEEWLYESFSEDGLYRMRAEDGSERERLAQGTISFINVLDDTVYYAAGKDDNRTIRRMNLDGTEEKRLVKADAYFLYAVGEWLYYQDLTLGAIMRLPVAGGEPEPISDEWFKDFLIHDGVLYAMRFPQGDDTKNIVRFQLPSLESSAFPYARRIDFCDGEWLYNMKNDSPSSPYVQVNAQGETGREFEHFGRIIIPMDGKMYVTDSRATVKGGSHDGANTGYIKVIDLETGVADVLIERQCLSFNVVEDWIVYWYWDLDTDIVRPCAYQISTGMDVPLDE